MNFAKLNASSLSLFLVLIVALMVVLSRGAVSAQTTDWQPSPGHKQIRIWPGAAPDLQPVAGPETETIDTTSLVAGRSVISESNVSQPTMIVYSPKGKNTGVCVVVFPGGGYQILAMDLEGTEVCDWLTSRGITAVLLKYRVPFSGPSWDDKLKHYVIPKVPTSLEDAQRALGLIRFHAVEWHIDPNKIGVIGFSAGGHLVAAMSTHFGKRLYSPVDAADKVGCRPDFAIALYPGHLWNMDYDSTPGFTLNPDIATHITSQTPPTFIVQAMDDPVDDVNNSLVYAIALKNAGVPVEMHLYAQGGHAFGLRRTKFPITGWPQLVDTWLKTIGMIPN